jgi:hypothetical protein
VFPPNDVKPRSVSIQWAGQPLKPALDVCSSLVLCKVVVGRIGVVAASFDKAQSLIRRFW